ncbi:PxKF domain-containing protein [Kitasatospora sp. NPDC059646]|uniref:PxKF domain-containing protein n=1 Tax=Kitasatospora sp. NPDC059646 TaxID=3346893 RepID=UPI00369A8D74
MTALPSGRAGSPGRPRGLRHRAAVASAAGALGALTAVVPVSSAHAADEAPAHRLVWIANSRANSVTAYDPATASAVATVPVGAYPQAVAVSPDGGEAYVVNNGSDTVSVIDTATGAVASTIPVGRLPGPVAFSPDGTHAYVGHYVSARAGGVDVIDTATRTVTATVTVGSQPFGIAVAPDGAHAYVANLIGGSVSVIDTATNSLSETIVDSRARMPAAVAVSPDGGRVYAANYASNNVSVIETATNTVSGVVPVGAGPGGVSVTPDGAHVYVANQNEDTVSVIDTASGPGVTDTVAVGATPVGVLVDPAGGTAFVANSRAGTLSVIDTATRTVTRTVDTGSAPYGLAVATVAPAVTGVRAGHGPQAGGNTVTIVGTHLAGARQVLFGTTPATGVTVVNDSTLRATAPARPGGAVDVTVTTPAGTSTPAAGARYTYEYPFGGFRPPVADPPAVNRMNAGRAVPVTFGLGGDRGPDVIARDYPTVTRVDCATGTPLDPPVPAATAGDGAPRYDAAAGAYGYRWKTDRAWAGSCRLFTLGLNDGTLHTALFRFS